MTKQNLPFGTRDEFGPIAEIKKVMQIKLANHFKQCGFQKITTPLIEMDDIFQSQKKEVNHYTMLDENGQKIVLRPDLTLPIARVMSTTKIELPVKWYYFGDVFQINPKMSGQYNQTTQSGIEIIGYQSEKAELEALNLAISGSQKLGIKDLTIQLGHADFIQIILEQLDLLEPTKEQLKKALIEKNLNRYDQLLGLINDSQYYQFLKDWPWSFGESTVVLDQLMKLPQTPAIKNIIQELKTMIDFIKSNFPSLKINLDLSIEAPQNYYTGLTFAGFNDASSTYLFSGGRYDHLLNDFQKEAISAVGFSYNLDSFASQLISDKPNQPTLIFFRTDQWQLAQTKLSKEKNATLCLVDSLAEAKQIAQKNNQALIDLTNQE